MLYSLELSQTQGLTPLASYFMELKKRLNIKSNSNLFKDDDFEKLALALLGLKEKLSIQSLKK